MCRSLPYLLIRCSPDCLEDESDITVQKPYFPINFKNRTPLLAAVQKQSKESLTPADESEECERAIFYRDDFALLTDDIECRLVRIEDISVLEACRNSTLVHFPDGKLLIRRSLGDCERRLDGSIFFRASRGCIVNLSQVKQPHLLEDGGLIFLLKDGKEVVFSRRQSILFRKLRGL